MFVQERIIVKMFGMGDSPPISRIMAESCLVYKHPSRVTPDSRKY